MCDEDPLTKDDMQFTVLFNVARIRPGETLRETFALKSEVRTKNTGRDRQDLIVHIGFHVKWGLGLHKQISLYIVVNISSKQISLCWIFVAPLISLHRFRK